MEAKKGSKNSHRILITLTFVLLLVALLFPIAYRFSYPTTANVLTNTVTTTNSTVTTSNVVGCIANKVFIYGTSANSVCTISPANVVTTQSNTITKGGNGAITFSIVGILVFIFVVFGIYHTGRKKGKKLAFLVAVILAVLIFSDLGILSFGGNALATFKYQIKFGGWILLLDLALIVLIAITVKRPSKDKSVVRQMPKSFEN